MQQVHADAIATPGIAVVVNVMQPAVCLWFGVNAPMAAQRGVTGVGNMLLLMTVERRNSTSLHSTSRVVCSCQPDNTGRVVHAKARFQCHSQAVAARNSLFTVYRTTVAWHAAVLHHISG
jgi:hypothetical protein